MKTIIPEMRLTSILLFLLTISPFAANAGSNYCKAEDTSWVHRLKDLRNALYTGDRAAVKSFIDFPVNNEHNEIWILASQDDVKDLNLPDAAIIPFTETDFDKHYQNVFPRLFIQAFLKVRTEKLFAMGKSDSPELKAGDTLIYTLYATVDKPTNILQLNFATRTAIKEGNKITDWIESNVIYFFDISNNKLKFKRVALAG